MSYPRFPASRQIRRTAIRILQTSVILGSFVAATIAEPPKVLWDHFAGETYIAGHADGPGPEALFAYPYGIDVDAQGNIFVADQGNRVIRKITPAGIVSTFSGRVGEFGTADGSATSARFSLLYGLTAHTDGNLYVVDNGRVRRIAPDGSVLTIAGSSNASPVFGDQVKPALSTALWDAHGIAVDENNNIFVSLNSSIVRITSQGLVSIWVDGNTPGINFQSPNQVTGLDIGPDGYLYYGSPFYGTVHRVSPTGSVESIGPTAYTTSAPYQWFSGVAVSATGQVHLAQVLAGAVSRLDDGALNLWVETTLEQGSTAKFMSPQNITMAPDGGVYLTDFNTHSIHHISPTGDSTVIAGSGVKLRSADRHRDDAVLAFTPRRVVHDGDNALYVFSGRTVHRFNLADDTYEQLVAPGDVPYEANSLHRAVADSQGNLYFSGVPANCISRRSAEGEWSIIAGAEGEADHVDGQGTAARFQSLGALTIDSAGNLFVADYNSDGQTIRKIEPNGSVTTYSGSPGQRAQIDGPRADARFIGINALAVGPDDSLWVGFSNSLRRIDSDGIVRSVAGGNPDFPWSDGVGSEAGFGSIPGIAVDATGNAYVVESADNEIRQVTPDGAVTTLPITGRYDTGNGTVNQSDIAASPDGRLYLMDLQNRRVLTGMVIPDAGRLANLSVLKQVGENGDKLTAGFVAEGDSPNPTLVRAVGPTLTNHGITAGFMPDPMLELFDRDGTLVETSDNWVNDAELIDTTARLGAFPLNAATTDASLVRPIPGGPFTATVSAADGRAGQVLVEVYDADVGGVSRLTNVSTLTRVSPGDGRLIAGFVITGEATEPKTVLIRGVGPSLTQFGYTGNQVLPDPRIRLFRGTELIATNDDWDNAPLLSEAFNAVGAFAFVGEDTTDAALLLRLSPGSYSVHLESTDGGSGQAIAEVYEVK